MLGQISSLLTKRAQPAPTTADESAKGPRVGQGVALSVPSWLGRRTACAGPILERSGDRLVMRCEEHLGRGQFVWLDWNTRRLEYFVHESQQDEDGFRVELRPREERRRSPRVEVSYEARIEWMDGLTRARATGRVTNRSARGAQIRLDRPGPGCGRVTVHFDDNTYEADVRYAMTNSSGCLMGVEFMSYPGSQGSGWKQR